MTLPIRRWWGGGEGEGTIRGGEGEWQEGGVGREEGQVKMNRKKEGRRGTGKREEEEGVKKKRKKKGKRKGGE